MAHPSITMDKLTYIYMYIYCDTHNPSCWSSTKMVKIVNNNKKKKIGNGRHLKMLCIYITPKRQQSLTHYQPYYTYMQSDTTLNGSTFYT